MEWKSKYRDMIFEINRLENTLTEYYDQNQYGKYIIQIIVRNNLGTVLDEIRFSEIDAIRILDSMSYFLENSGGYGDSMVIYINPNNSKIEVSIFDLQVVALPDNFYNDQDPDGARDIQFTINHYSKINGGTAPVASTLITSDELYDLMYAIFFVSLLDVDVSMEYLSEVEALAEKIMMNNYY